MVESATELFGEFASGFAGGGGGIAACFGADGTGLAVGSDVAEVGASARGGGTAVAAARAAAARTGLVAFGLQEQFDGLGLGRDRFGTGVGPGEDGAGLPHDVRDEGEQLDFFPEGPGSSGKGLDVGDDFVDALADIALGVFERTHFRG